MRIEGQKWKRWKGRTLASLSIGLPIRTGKFQSINNHVLRCFMWVDVIRMLSNNIESPIQNSEEPIINQIKEKD